MKGQGIGILAACMVMGLAAGCAEKQTSTASNEYRPWSGRMGAGDSLGHQLQANRELDRPGNDDVANVGGD